MPLLLLVVGCQAHEIARKGSASEGPMQVQRGLSLTFKIEFLILDCDGSRKDGQRLLWLVLPQLRMSGWKLARRKVCEGVLLKDFHDDVVGAVGALGGSLQRYTD